MNTLTKVIKTSSGRNQIYYTSSNGDYTPVDLAEMAENADTSTLINHLYTIMEKLNEYESTGLSPKQVKKILCTVLPE